VTEKSVKVEKLDRAALDSTAWRAQASGGLSAIAELLVIILYFILATVTCNTDEIKRSKIRITRSYHP